MSCVQPYIDYVYANTIVVDAWKIIYTGRRDGNNKCDHPSEGKGVYLSKFTVEREKR